MENDVDKFITSPTEILEQKNNNHQCKILREDMKCSPDKPCDQISCISLKNLIIMAKAYNEEYPENTIQLKKSGNEVLYPSKYKKYLVEQFEEKLKKKCDNQICWTKQKFMDRIPENKDTDELSNYTFRPEGPQGKFEWVNTTHINKVMKPYEKVNHDFIFLGAVPLDFHEIEY